MVHFIKATDNFFTLLHNNQPKIIGRIERPYFSSSKSKFDVMGSLVIFDFDNDGNQDLFFFNNEKLVLNLICDFSYKNRFWLYQKNLQPKSVDEFIKKVVEEYTFNELGY